MGAAAAGVTSIATVHDGAPAAGATGSCASEAGGSGASTETLFVAAGNGREGAAGGGARSDDRWAVSSAACCSDAAMAASALDREAAVGTVVPAAAAALGGDDRGGGGGGGSGCAAAPHVAAVRDAGDEDVDAAAELASPRPAATPLPAARCCSDGSMPIAIAAAWEMRRARGNELSVGGVEAALKVPPPPCVAGEDAADAPVADDTPPLSTSMSRPPLILRLAALPGVRVPLPAAEAGTTSSSCSGTQ